jgi:hypothetical protein
MDFDWQKFVNPAQFSNANYITDLNPAGGMSSLRDVAASSMGLPVKPHGETPPPETNLSFEQMAKTAIAPHTNRFQQISNTVSKVGNAISNGLPPLPNLNPTTPQMTPSMDYDYTHGLE